MSHSLRGRNILDKMWKRLAPVTGTLCQYEMKIIVTKNEIDFPFEKYCNFILTVAEKPDLIGISEIRFIQEFSHPKSDKASLACYLQGANGKNAVIELNIPNISKEKIANYYFERHPEIAALWLSEIIFHEIGHHVHHFKRHGIKKTKNENFSGKYAGSGYYHYLLSRKEKILASYKWGARNFIELSTEERNQFKENHQDLIDWLVKNKEGIPFP